LFAATQNKFNDGLKRQ